MTNKNRSLIFWGILAVLTINLFASSFVSCNDKTEDLPQFRVPIQDRGGNADTIILASSSHPCDSVMYLPVAWGAELRPVPRSIATGQRRPFPPHWQVKGQAWQLIPPTRYQQDSMRERVMFADSLPIYYTDTFYICRKIIL